MRVFNRHSPSAAKSTCIGTIDENNSGFTLADITEGHVGHNSVNVIRETVHTQEIGFSRIFLYRRTGVRKFTENGWASGHRS